MASSEELKSELFNMKMKCHEYEQRLMQVNLHGLDGETLQSRNAELEGDLEKLKTVVADNEDEISSLKGILVKTKGAMERLVTSNRSLRTQVDQLEIAKQKLGEDVLQKTNMCNSFQTEAELGRKYLSELEETRASLKEVQDQLAGKIRLASKVPELEGMVTSLRKSISKLEERIKKKDDQLTLLELRLRDETTKAKAACNETESQKHDLTVAMAREKELVVQQYQSRCSQLEDTITTVTRELEIAKDVLTAKEAECERYSIRSQSYMERERQASSELARLRAEVENFQQHKQLTMEKLREQFEIERAKILEECDKRYFDAQKLHSKQVSEKEVQYERLLDLMSTTKEKHRESVSQYKSQIVQLEKEVHSVKTKWKSSMTAKRKQTNPVSKENSHASSNPRKPKTTAVSSASKHKQTKKPSFR
mmetsp:Transcript_43157/g.69185  ORF Transcript_43157/g.69185 Transcript_43157/m.69185 type:complete len:423 (-) Transcript_43157:2504-3772(-)